MTPRVSLCHPVLFISGLSAGSLLLDIAVIQSCRVTGAQLDDRDTFLGVGTNRLVRWDQRAAQGVVQDMSSPTVSYAGGKDYARGTNFSCMATSGILPQCPNLTHCGLVLMCAGM